MNSAHKGLTLPLAALLVAGCVYGPDNHTGLRRRNSSFQVYGYGPTDSFTADVQQKHTDGSWFTVMTKTTGPATDLLPVLELAGET